MSSHSDTGARPTGPAPLMATRNPGVQQSEFSPFSQWCLMYFNLLLILFNSLDINGSMIKMSQVCIAFIYKVIDYYCVYLQGGHCMFLLGLFAGWTL